MILAYRFDDRLSGLRVSLSNLNTEFLKILKAVPLFKTERRLRPQKSFHQFFNFHGATQIE